MRRLSALITTLVLSTAGFVVVTFSAPAHAAPPTCFGQPATIVSNGPITGTNGNDVIVGGDAAQSINGKGGNDRICGKGGDDNIDGGSGDDLIDGGGGNDKIAGGDGNDELHGGSGDDRLDGNGGKDQIFGEGGNDKADGGSGTDGCATETEKNCEGDPITLTECNDGIDNDGDGFIDASSAPPTTDAFFDYDPGCTGPDDTSEYGTLQCDNGIDDDHDGYFDYGAFSSTGSSSAPVRGDTDCTGPADDSEFPSCSPLASTDPHSSIC